MAYPSINWIKKNQMRLLLNDQTLTDPEGFCQTNPFSYFILFHRFFTSWALFLLSTPNNHESGEVVSGFTKIQGLIH